MQPSSSTNVAIDNLHSSASQSIWVLHIFILQCRLEQIFFLVVMLKLPSSNLPKNPQGAPILLVFYVLSTLQVHVKRISQSHSVYQLQSPLYPNLHLDSYTQTARHLSSEIYTHLYTPQQLLNHNLPTLTLPWLPNQHHPDINQSQPVTRPEVSHHYSR